MSEDSGTPAPGAPSGNPAADIMKGVGQGLANTIAPRTTHIYKSLRKRFSGARKTEKKKASELFGMEIK